MSEEIKNEALETSEATSEVSKSKAKREARNAEVKAEKAKKNFDSILGVVIGLIIAAIVIGVIVAGIVTSTKNTTTVAAGNYSEGLTAEGYIEKADLSKVKDLGVESLVINAADVEYSDEDVEADIQSALSSAATYSDDKALEVKDGDNINLDYVGSVDGVEFEGGSTNGTGTTLTIGSHSYIDDFEEQLIGAHPGDSVTVNVTFPDNYGNADLAGKDAKFECVVNSVLVTPELTDEFVKENYSEFASTVEELRAYAKAEGHKSKVMDYISNYISENAEVSKAPKAYLAHLKSLIKFTDEQTFNYYNQYYYYMTGTYMYNDFSDFTGKTESEYEDGLVEEALHQAAIDMTYEAIFKNNNLTISEDVLNEVSGMYGDTAQYGEAYVNQVAQKYSVLYFLLDQVTIQ